MPSKWALGKVDSINLTMLSSSQAQGNVGLPKVLLNPDVFLDPYACSSSHTLLKSTLTQAVGLTLWSMRPWHRWMVMAQAPAQFIQ